MHFFTDERIAKIKAKGDDAIVRLSVDVKTVTRRDEIEQRLSSLPINAQTKLIAKLESAVKDSHKFMGFYYELVVGSELCNRKYSIEYEHAIGNLTPDWFVRLPDTTCLIEVTSRNASQERRKRDKGTNEISRQLQQIPVGIVVGVEFIDHSDAAIGISPDVADVVAKATTWLESDPAEGDEIEFEGSNLLMSIRCKRLHPKSVALIGPSEAAFSNPNGLRDAIAQKVQKYRRTTSPIIVAVTLDFMAWADSEDLREVLLGSEGLFAEYPSLSGCWHFEINGQTGHAQFHYLPNPAAQLPVHFSNNEELMRQQ